MEPIRVLHMMGNLDVGGSQMMILNIYRNINREKIQFDFILDDSDKVELLSEVLSLGAKVYYLPKYNGKNIFHVKREWNSFFENHPEYKILHSHVRSYAAIFVPIAKRHGIKTIVHSHSTSNGGGISSVVKAMLQYPLRFQADYLFSCSKEAGKWLFGEKATKKSNYFVIRNAVDLERFGFNNNFRTEIRNSLGIGESESLACVVGRVSTPKNPKFIIEIAKKIKSLNWKIVWCGTGEHFESVKKEIKSTGIEEILIMAGERNDVYKIMSASDVFILPSLWEGLPVVAVESQACGLPTILSNRITKDVEISDLVSYLPIDQGEDVWIEKMIEESRKRHDVTSDIIGARFDIDSSATWIQDFYINICMNI